MISNRTSLRTAIASLIFICLPFQLVHGQEKNNSMVVAGNPIKLLVITDRQTDTLTNGDVVYTNEVDTCGRLKYLLVTVEGKSWYAREFADLRSLMDNPMPHRDWAVWVHGDGQTFVTTLQQATEIQQLHQVNLIVFAWPTLSPDKGAIANFRNSQQNAILSATYLHHFFHELEQYKRTEFNRIQGGHVSIFFHSLGCYMLEAALDTGYLQDMPATLFDNLVISQAATPSEGHAQWVERLKIQQRIYITSNDGDLNLEGLRIISSLGYQLGERPLPPLANNATYLDFSDAIGFRLPTGATHSFYFATVTAKSTNIREIFTILFQGYPLRFADESRFEATGDPQVIKVLF
jgi:hypothetical protein